MTPCTVCGDTWPIRALAAGCCDPICNDIDTVD